MNKEISMLIEKYELGHIELVEQFDSLQNRVFRVITTSGKYVIKEFSKDSIGNYYQLQKRKKQIEVSKLLDKKGIKCCLPITVERREFLTANGRYYLLYDYVGHRPLEVKDVTLDHIDVLASTQARIHKIKNHVPLSCSYKKIKIDFDKLSNIETISSKNERSMSSIFPESAAAAKSLDSGIFETVFTPCFAAISSM